MRGVPYDRPLTTMAGFAMCPACRAEYDDPSDRRFHAQPNACPACGPRVRLVGDAPAGRDDVERAARALLAGAIVAVKGIGGVHLACRADDDAAVARLRARKHREDRPFALMARGRGGGACARVARRGGRGAADVAGAADRAGAAGRRRGGRRRGRARAWRELGVMLPYAPLHHLLLGDAGVALVMTSGNVSDEPIAFRDDDALERLAGIADLFLLHDRPIETRVDDSVARVVRGRPTVLRRSRGLVPAAIGLPVACARPVLACGAELKSTFCLARGRRAWVGHHIGDLRNAETLASFREGIAHFEELFDVRPEVVAHDLHPQYLSTSYALERDGVELVGVQHHHAHLAACLAEHGVTAPAVGAIYDGTGHGTDGTAWGGEILLGDLRSFERIGHLPAVRLPGGDRAVREPWRMACAWLVAVRGEIPAIPVALRDHVAPDRWDAVARMALERVRGAGDDEHGPSVRRRRGALRRPAGRDLRGPGGDRARGARRRRRSPGPIRPTPHELVAAVAADACAGVPVPLVSARFHRAVAAWTAAACAAAGTEHVVLSGGVFQNRLLLSLDGGAPGGARPHRPGP